MSRTDEQLLYQVARGSSTALEALERKHSGHLHRYALARLGDPEDARDAVQETLIAVWGSAGTYRGASSVSTWVLGILRNKIGERLRRRVSPAEPLETIADQAAPGSVAGAAIAWDCFRALTDEEQELMLLVFHYGFSQREVAQILGIPEGTVKSRTHYARLRLQRLLDGGE